MFSIELQILGLSECGATNSSYVFKEFPITIRFGPLETNIMINGDSGGKRLVLEMEVEEMEKLLKTYAFGLFIRN
jgi:hypothetical protein